MENKYYTTNEIADILGVTQRTVYNYIKAGELSGSKIGRGWRVAESELSRFVKKGTSPAYMQILLGR